MAPSRPHLTAADGREVTPPTLVIVGDDDMLSFAHTVALYESLPDARLAVVPDTSHLLPVEAPDELLRLVRRFLDGEAPKRLMPMRHAPPARGT